jgi:hypothetical protein
MSGRHKLITQKSDSNGIAVFHGIDLSSIAWSVSIQNGWTVATDPAVILCKPENASAQGLARFFTISITSLPAEITIHFRKRSFGEQMQRLLVIP